MKKPSLKDIFCSFIVILSVLICCILIILMSKTNVKHKPNFSVSHTTENTAKIKVIKMDETVYITDAGKSFHKNLSCIGDTADFINITVSDAISKGKFPCKRCLKNYVIVK